MRRFIDTWVNRIIGSSETSTASRNGAHTDAPQLRKPLFRKAIFRAFVLGLLAVVTVLDDAEAGVLTRGQRTIAIRLRRRPRMHLNQRVITSSQVLGKTNPNMRAKSASLDPAKQIEAEQKADEEWRKKYTKWRSKQIKTQQRIIEKEKKERAAHQLKLKKEREVEQRKIKKAESIKQAPLNPWFGSKKATETGVIDLKKEKEEAKPKDSSRRVPLLKQLWHSIFG